MSWNSTLGDFIKLLENRFELDDVLEKISTLPYHHKVLYSYELLHKNGLLQKIEDPRAGSRKSAVSSTTHRNLGNELFYSKNYHESFKYYVKSVASAPSNSKELATAYSNRSAVLFNLGRNSASLIDINRALNQPYPENLEPKLRNRKHMCLEKLRELNQQTKTILDFVRNSLSDVSITDNWLDDTVERGFKSCEIPDDDAINPNYDNKFPLPNAELDNELMINATKRMRISYNEKLGKHLVATVNIDPGEAVIIDKPFSAVLMPEFVYTHCSYCFLRCEILIPCPECNTVMFCSEKCLREALDAFHSVECRFLDYVFTLELDRIALLAFRTLLVASEQGKGLLKLMNDPFFNKPFLKQPFREDTVYKPGDYSSIHNMIDNFHMKDSSFQFYRCCTSAKLIHILKTYNFFNETTAEKLEKMEEFAGTLLLKFMYIAEVNSHDICEVLEREEDKREISLGAGLYPLVSKSNHSCNPNIIRFNHKNLMVFYTLAPVMAGEQLCDSYGIHFTSKSLEERRKITQKLGFNCECEACTLDWRVYEELPVSDPEYISHEVNKTELERYSSMFNEWMKDPMASSIMNEYKFLCSYLSLLRNNIKMPWKEYFECQEALRQMISMRSNYYTYYNDLLL